MSCSTGPQQPLHRAYGYAFAHPRDHATAADVLVAFLRHDLVAAATTVPERCDLTGEQVPTALAAGSLFSAGMGTRAKTPSTCHVNVSTVLGLTRWSSRSVGTHREDRRRRPRPAFPQRPIRRRVARDR